ncbi:MAG: PAS domain S-box protein [Acidobacteria bacterium]|nr:PAS domain S-box protein [Acidobacteriota bacterium]
MTDPGQQFQARPVRSLVAGLLRWITEPTASLLDPLDRATATSFGRIVIAGLSVLLCSEIYNLWTYPHHRFNWSGVAALVAGYLLNRKGHLKAAALVVVVAIPVLTFIRIAGDVSSRPVLSLYLLSGNLFLTALFLSARAVSVVAVAQTVMIALMPKLAPAIVPGLDPIVGPLMTHGVTIVLVAYFLFRRDRAEASRQAELRVTADRLALALEGARTGIWDWRIASGDVKWSGQVEALFGLVPGTFGGTFDAYAALIHPDDRDVLRKAIESAMADPSEPFGVEHRIVRPDGTVRWVEGRGRVYRDAHGRPERMAGAVTDITERKEAEQALRQSEERFRLLADSSSEAIVISDGGVVVDANPQVAAMLGLKPDEVIGRHVLEFATPEAVSEIEKRLASEEYAPYQTVLRRSDGTQFPVDVRGRFLQSGSRRLRLAVIHDLTESRRGEDDRVALERQVQHSQKLESLGVLAGGIAHDFNNLLVAMLGNLELALDDLPPQSDVRPYLRDAESAAKRAAALTAKLLAYSGRGRFEVRPMDINAVITEMSSTIRSAVRRSIRFDMKLGADVPIVEGDPTQVHQLVMNLIVNAAEAIGDAAGNITLTTGAREWTREELRGGHVPDVAAAGPFVFLTISDTGSGMDQTVKARLFEPFFTTKFTGRGLGMAAVLGILRAHKGTIFVESEPGQGATVTVLFPASLASAETEVVEPAAGVRVADASTVGRPTVLIVDDEDTVRSICRQMLERLGYEVEAVGSGREAVELLRQPTIHVGCVLLDLTMPGMDGAETAAAIQQLRPDLPIVIASGYSEPEVVERLGATRVASVVQKPYQLRTLRDTLGPLVAPARR